MNILGCLSYPYTYHFDHFGAFLHFGGCFGQMQNWGLKLKVDFGIHHIQIQQYQVMLKMLANHFYPKMPETP